MVPLWKCRTIGLKCLKSPPLLLTSSVYFLVCFSPAVKTIIYLIYTNNKRLPFALRKNNIYACLYGRPLLVFRLLGSKVDGCIVILLLYGGSDLVGLPSKPFSSALIKYSLGGKYYNLLHNDIRYLLYF